MHNRKVILQQAAFYDSFYLYDEKKILEYTSLLKRDFDGVDFLYSVKSNPNPVVVKTVFSQGFGSDAASLAEVLISSHLGVSKERVQYSAPGKSIRDIEQAMNISTIIADSLDEIARVQLSANKKGIIVEIGVRVNPDFTFYAQSGIPSKFGIDEKSLLENMQYIKGLENVRVSGLHVHLRSQELSSDVLEKYYENIFTLAVSFQKKMGTKLKFINFGSGLGIPYEKQDKALDTVSLGKATSKLIAFFKEKLPNVKIYIETGRFAVGKSGVYVTKVMDIKKSYGKTFIILHNTLNGFIRPSLAQLVLAYSNDENPAGSEPLFTSKNAFEFIALTDETEEEVVTLVGNLCTAADVVAKDILMPKLKYGDIVVITNAGSYAAAISPMQFSSQAPPAQLFLTCNGEVVDTTK